MRLLWAFRREHGWVDGVDQVYDPRKRCGHSKPHGMYVEPPQPDPMEGRLIWVVAGDACFGLVTRDGKVRAVPPIGKRWKITPGMDERDAAAALSAAGAKFRHA